MLKDFSGRSSFRRLQFQLGPQFIVCIDDYNLYEATCSLSCESIGRSSPSTLPGDRMTVERSAYERMILARSARRGSFMPFSWLPGKASEQ